MYLFSEVDNIYKTLRESASLSECDIIKAFPYAKKPTRLKRTVITVSPAEARLKNIALGGECAYGTYSVSLDIFTPQEQGSPAQSDTTDRLISAVLSLEPAEIRLSGFKENDSLGALCAECVITFSSAAGENQED